MFSSRCYTSLVRILIITNCHSSFNKFYTFDVFFNHYNLPPFALSSKSSSISSTVSCFFNSICSHIIHFGSMEFISLTISISDMSFLAFQTISSQKLKIFFSSKVSLVTYGFCCCKIIRKICIKLIIIFHLFFLRLISVVD